ncbi:MAG TPA: hypothetical protein VL588_10630 [Bdellovibrionota bacterium]|nr:hypothetical protein [Bdellovibrionota bacterium]
MKRQALSAVLTVLALTSTAALTGCDDVGQITVTRTAETPSPLVQTADVPVYRTDCAYHQVFGPHPSCGYNTVCHTYYDSNHHPYQRCTQVMNSCYHTEASCFDVFSHTTHATLRMWFDEGAVLLPGESEKIDLWFSGRYTRKELRMGVRDSRYRYDFPALNYVDMVGPTADLDVHFRVNDVKEVRPQNNVTIESAQFTEGGQTLRIVFTDPYRSLHVVRGSTYRFQLKRGLNTYFDGSYRSADFPADQEHMVVEIRKGSPEWKKDPRPGKKHSLKWSVERDSDLFKDSFSATNDMTVRF